MLLHDASILCCSFYLLLLIPDYSLKSLLCIGWEHWQYDYLQIILLIDILFY